MTINPKLKQFIEVADMALDGTQLVSFIVNLFRGPNASEGDRKAADVIDRLSSEGKPKEALDEALKAFGTMFGMKDEMRLARDIAILVDTGKISIKKIPEFAAFLRGLSPRERSKFRDAYVTEKERALRLMLITLLIKLKTNEARRDYLEGNGMFDQSMLEKSFDSLIEPLSLFSDAAVRRTEVLKERRAERNKSKLEADSSATSSDEDEPKRRTVSKWLDEHPVLKTLLTFSFTAR